MNFGIEPSTGQVYEANGGPLLPVQPLPVVVRAVLMDDPTAWPALPGGLQHDAQGWLFREIDFDPVTRVRRGRLYESAPGVPMPGTVDVVRSQLDDWRPAQSATSQGKIRKEIFAYFHCTTLLRSPNGGQGKTLVLGNDKAASAWLILLSECEALGTVLVTLRSKSAFGVLPELGSSTVPMPHRAAVIEAYDRVLSAAFRETPISVVDQCRNALVVMVSRWMLSRQESTSVLKKDLAELANTIETTHKSVVVAAMCKAVARFHARGKGNEQYTRGLRTPSEGDAELALHAVATVIREFEWAN